MNILRLWGIDYFEEMFAKPDPWKYFTSPYERTKYERQLGIIKDRILNPRDILEVGCAEGAMTLLLADLFEDSRITAIEISITAFRRAENNLKQFMDRIKLINADIVEYQAKIAENHYDVIIWSESIYYSGARLSLIDSYDLMDKMIGKLKAGGILVIANTLDLPEGIPESAIVKRPLIDCYFIMISSLLRPISKSTYIEEKLGRMYEYQIWAFEKE
jgi:SAM-dependent methyltransferase